MTDFDFDQQIGIAHLRAAGWQPQITGGASPFDCHAFYLTDFGQAIQHVVAVPMLAFEGTTPTHPMDLLVAGVSQLLGEAANAPGDHQLSERLAFCATAYMKQTQTYRQWKGRTVDGDRGHFFLNLYGSKYNRHMRPFAVGAPNSVTVMDSDFVGRYAERVRNSDSVKHPEWFA